MSDEAGKPPAGDDKQPSSKPAAGTTKRVASKKAGRAASVGLFDGDESQREAERSDVHGRPSGEASAGPTGQDRPVRPARKGVYKTIIVDGKPYQVRPKSDDFRRLMRRLDMMR